MQDQRPWHLLRRLVGQLRIDDDAQQQAFDELIKSLGETVSPDDPPRPVQSDFSITNTDLFQQDVASSRALDSLDRLTAEGVERPGAARFRVAAREVPVQERLLHASVPDWAAGARAARSIGPFAHADGRRFWFDFYPIIKLMTLYIQGETAPAMLFKVRRSRFSKVGGDNGYEISPGSVWIDARLLAPGAPVGRYVGLTVEGGEVELSAAGIEQDDVITVSSSTSVAVRLDLQQPSITEADSDSEHGADARALQLALPKRLRFTFSGSSQQIDEVSDAAWTVYGQALSFAWTKAPSAAYDAALQRVVFPFTASEPTLKIGESLSATHRVDGSATITRSGWTLPVAVLDVSQPIEASGIGELMAQTGPGLTDRWRALEGGPLQLAGPTLMIGPGIILLADLTASNAHARHDLSLWRDEVNPFGTTATVTFAQPAPYYYTVNANGTELLMSLVDADLRVDRPVKVDDQPPVVRSLQSLLVLAVSPQGNLAYLFDDNMLQDAALLAEKGQASPPMALAVSNALFRTTQVNGCLLFGTLREDFAAIDDGLLFLTFGLYAYLPTLPDPYAADLGVLQRQIRGRDVPAGVASASALVGNRGISAWLVCRIAWEPIAEAPDQHAVEVSFHFAPASDQFAGISLEDDDEETTEAASASLSASTAPAEATAAVNPNIASAVLAATADASARPVTSSLTDANVAARAAINIDDDRLPDYEGIWDEQTQQLTRYTFALLDVSTNADLFGVSFEYQRRKSGIAVTHAVPSATDSPLPVQIDGMDVISQGYNVKAFTVPQISWEPVVNLSQPAITGDPPLGPNYYPDDGGPTQILNTSEDTVALAPLPLTGYLVDGFQDKPDTFAAYAFLTLPFGLKALAVLQDEYKHTQNGVTSTRRGTQLTNNAQAFEDEVKGGLQLQIDAGEALIQGESDMFIGSTVQLNNVLNVVGAAQGDSTLGRTVTKVFNNEFLLEPWEGLVRGRGIPLTRIDLSGYGASTFSNWLNPTAAFAETSQARFDVMVGRCAHEVIQIKSIVYPWGIKVVRTITLFRVGSGYVHRVDSGWRAESAGEFDFRYFVNLTPTDKQEQPSPFDIHPGVIKGLFNVQNIIETEEIARFSGEMVSAKIVSGDGLLIDNPDPGDALSYELQPVYFDADIEIEDVVSGFNSQKIRGTERKLVASKRIVGYVQVAPRGIPIDAATLNRLINTQPGGIGGAIDCEVDLAESGQKMRLSRFDFNNSVGSNGSDLTFAAAGRGSVLLPKEGAWSMVQHERGTGQVSPVPSNLSVPVIRNGLLTPTNAGPQIQPPPSGELLRIAEPEDLLRSPVDDTINYGLLQSTDTQKALFLTPAFEAGQQKLFSKTPPLFVDAFRIVNSKAVFPNIGDGETDLGEAISLLANGSEFAKGALQDLGADVWELLDLTSAADNAAEQGFKLLKQVTSFDLPDLEFELIDLGDGNFRIYIEYDRKDNNGSVLTKGELDFDIDSLANNLADTWKSRMGNIGLVVDLAGIDRLMTIRGNWDSKKGAQASYPEPELVFADELQPVIDILEILQQIQTGDYAGAVADGLQLAMSNKAGSWEYKFEASKEIPVLRFPVPDAIYNDPNTPFKLEAGLKLGAYFNAALNVTSNTNELLPSAGGFLGFYGRLSVMCVSLSAATVYAIGQVNLDIAADTKIGPSLRMKFGFGAQVVVGLPVAGNVSVLFMVGVEIFAASGIIEVSAFMLFEGHAEILGGIVAITIRIEALGKVSKKAIGSDNRTDLTCQVTFGLDISIFLVINISFETSWSEQRRIA